MKATMIPNRVHSLRVSPLRTLVSRETGGAPVVVTTWSLPLIGRPRRSTLDAWRSQ